MSEQNDRFCDALQRLDTAVRRFNPSHIFGLFSGGHDSLVATFIAAQHPRFTAVVHINTGIGIMQTREFVDETCDRFGWPLLEYKAVDNVDAKGRPDPQIYDELVLEHGFPGPTRIGHNKMYHRLKERQIARLIRDHKRHRRDRIILVSGCRSHESRRQMGHVTEVQTEGGRVWNAIIHDWTKRDVDDFLNQRRIPRNPVVLNLCKSGECLCGAFARPGELDDIAFHYPLAAARIRALEQRVMRRFPWGWESGPPQWWLDAKRRQLFLFEMDEMGRRPTPLCHSCIAAETQSDAR